MSRGIWGIKWTFPREIFNTNVKFHVRHIRALLSWQDYAARMWSQLIPANIIIPCTINSASASRESISFSARHWYEPRSDSLTFVITRLDAATSRYLKSNVCAWVYQVWIGREYGKVSWHCPFCFVRHLVPGIEWRQIESDAVFQPEDRRFRIAIGSTLKRYVRSYYGNYLFQRLCDKYWCARSLICTSE